MLLYCSYWRAASYGFLTVVSIAIAPVSLSLRKLWARQRRIVVVAVEMMYVVVSLPFTPLHPISYHLISHRFLLQDPSTSNPHSDCSLVGWWWWAGDAPFPPSCQGPKATVVVAHPLTFFLSTSTTSPLPQSQFMALAEIMRGYCTHCTTNGWDRWIVTYFVLVKRGHVIARRGKRRCFFLV